MERSHESRPQFLNLPPDLEARLSTPGLLESAGLRRGDFETVLRCFFEGGRFSWAKGQYTGATPEAIQIVQGGLVSSLERGVQSGGLENVIFPADDYIKNPDPSILALMQARTDHIKQRFMIDDMKTALRESHGRFLEGHYDDLDHSDYKHVDVFADDHTYFGFKYRFYKGKLARGEQRPADLSYALTLNFMYPREAPQITSREYPYYVGMGGAWSVPRQPGEMFVENEFIEIPAEHEPLLAEVAQRLVIDGLGDALVQEAYMETVRDSNRRSFARDMLEGVVDPVEARDILEALGIDDDPEKYQ